jgi:hypothetical protein
MPGRARHPEDGIASDASGRLIQATRVDFIAVPVEDLARADAFYGQTLGLARNPHTSGEK